jgi:hypothetical protein
MVTPTLRRRRRISFGSLEQGGTRNSADVGLERTQRLDYASAGLIVALENSRGNRERSSVVPRHAAQGLHMARQ